MKRFLLLCSLISCSFSVFSQVEWESQIWTSAEFEYNFKGPWSVGIAPEVRWRTSPFMARTIFPDVSAGYNINKQFSVTGHYRYVYTNEGMGNYIINHKVMFDGSYRRKMDNIQYGFRLRLGTMEDEQPEPELLQTQTWEVREKLSITYRIKKKLDCYASVEFFQAPVEGWTEFQQLRFVVGTEYSLNRSQQLQVGLMFQDRPDVKRLNPVITYSLDLDKLKQKKEKIQE